MCIEINEYKDSLDDDFSQYFNLKDIDKDAEILLNKFYDNSTYQLDKSRGKSTPIIEIAKIMGFKIYTGKFKERNLSGTIGISEKLRNQGNLNW